MQILETNDEVRVQAQHYSAILSRKNGGLLTALRSRKTGATVLEGFGIYTDYGIYAERGYVGTRNESRSRITINRANGRLLVTTTGALKGKVAPRDQLIHYKVTYAFDSSPHIYVDCQLMPSFERNEVRAFLAVRFRVPSLREWTVRTQRGFIHQDARIGPQRSYQDVIEPLDWHEPLIIFRTKTDGALAVTKVKCRAPTVLQNVIIHGEAFFLTWLDGRPAPLLKSPYQMQFRLTVDQLPMSLSTTDER
ncbi:MAG TPA: hypothetical protein EYP10_01590 [Armatimonadetes bacterium]|nr:hypothetical protein [Armatimonadota bacterium]